VIALGFTPQYAILNRTTSILMRCFGAQAMTAGLLLSASTMTVHSFTAFGLAMIPYLGFNAWFGIGPGRGVFTKWLWMDFIGNMVFLSGSLVAAKLLRDGEEEQKKKKTI
jgi:ABC-type multidrug transport system permease subunit